MTRALILGATVGVAGLTGAGPWGEGHFAASGPPLASVSLPADLTTGCGLNRVRVRSGNRTKCIGIWAYLRRRPLRVPSLGRGSPCPTAEPSGDLANLAPGVVGTAFGRGPVPASALPSEQSCSFAIRRLVKASTTAASGAARRLCGFWPVHSKARPLCGAGSSADRTSCVSTKAWFRHVSGGCAVEVGGIPPQRAFAHLAATRIRSTVCASAT
jgi:hypothetical protein